jgi:hypothetical protein
MAKCVNLTDLDMSSCSGLRANGLDLFCANPPPQLAALNLSECKLGYPGGRLAALNLLDACDSLTSLDLTGNGYLTQVLRTPILGGVNDRWVEPRFSQYAKMKKMNLPDGAVRQKMMANEESDADIAYFFGESAPAPTAAAGGKPKLESLIMDGCSALKGARGVQYYDTHTHT